MGSIGGFVRKAPDWFAIGMDGRYFNSGAGPMTVVQNGVYKLRIDNPSDSEALVAVHRFRYWAASVDEKFRVILNPTGNLPSTVKGSASQRLGSPDGKAVVTADTTGEGTEMTGGSALPYLLPARQDQLEEYLIYPARIIPPGNSIAAELTNDKASSTDIITIVDWYEIPL